MKIIQPKIFLALLVYILAICPNACLLEQAIAAVVHSVADSHDENKSQERHESAPSHKHDEEGSGNVFCCDNTLNFYLVSQTLAQIDACEQFSSLLPLLAGPEVQANSSYAHLLYHFRPPPGIRCRDKYALSCLLHAPPQI